MIKLKTKEEIEILREGGAHLAQILKTLSVLVEPGLETRQLDEEARNLIKSIGAIPSFLNYKPHGSRLSYPTALCVSVNDEIVHGIPSPRILEMGDIVTLDLGLCYKGLFTDSAITVPVGEISKPASDLIARTKTSLDKGIEAAIVGNHVGDIGFAVESYIKQFGYGLIDDLTGHGVGFAVHEEPQVPNFGRPKTGEKLVPGLVIAIEPMVALGDKTTDLLEDEFTFVTADKSLSAHFEHTIAVTEDGPLILTMVN